MLYSLTKCIFCQLSVNEVLIYVLPTYCINQLEEYLFV